ncbi:MAG: valine--tRNA ligase [Candidatus Sungbacteria bacterium]|nr:valine--tRNA ligase [Candidatus Sungbacteria bacterium]
MTTQLSPQYNPKEVEDKIYRLWEESGVFAPEAHQPRADNPDNLSKPTTHNLQPTTYTIVVPPPNVTGSLHLGHALNAVIQDILIRKKRMQGFQALWLPGTDHAGIATQNVVEKELKKKGTNRYDLKQEGFIEEVWRWKEKYGNIILGQFKKLGSSMDWSRTRFTMDEGYQKAVEEAFRRYYEKGWIYRAERVINWCPRCQTSLADLELEYKEVETKLYYIYYPIKSKEITDAFAKLWAPLPKSASEALFRNKYKFDPDKTKHIRVATTRPETMLGDAAVAVNPKDERYKGFVGEKVMLPIQNREIPIVADDAVEMEFGTGAVKVTPSHDLLDAEIAERHNLPRHTVINAFGKMTKEAGALCEGLKAGECREKVVEELKQNGFLEKEEPYKHNVAVCYRCATAIEPIPSLQWFLKMAELARLAIDAVKSKKVTFHPDRWKKVYLDRLENEKDWTISRQIWWGHRIPVWYHEPKCVPKNGHEDDVVKCQELLISEKEPKCEFCDAKFVQDPDVLDTWFSSALWPFAVMGWPASASAENGSASGGKATAGKPSDLKQFYPTQVLSTARDIISIWVAKMVFSGMFFIGKEPFSDVIIHATILTKEGKRMSKSLGTGVDPMTLIEKYGADALRFGLIWQAMGGQDIRWSEEHVVAGKKFANKVWNAARFVITNLQLTTYNQQQPVAKTPADKEIIEKFEKTKKGVSADIEEYDFGHALNNLYDFFWHEFCDKYIESAKQQLNKEDTAESTQNVLCYILTGSLKLLHPFMPFLTEEIWSHLPAKDKKLLIVEDW